MYNRHTDQIRQPPTRPASWDRPAYAPHHERIPIQPRADGRPPYPDSRRQPAHGFDDSAQPDLRFQPVDRPARASYSGQPRAHPRLLPPSPFSESRAPFEDAHSRRQPEFPSSPHSRHLSYPHHNPRIVAEPYHHTARPGPPPFRSYPPQGPAHQHESSHPAWNQAPQHPKYYEANTQFNHGPPKEKSTPTQSVIFMGLPIHTDEASLRDFLEQRGGVVDTVTIIYDRNTGLSKRYGFARFASVEHARAFVEPSFPLITWKEPMGSRFDKSGEGLKVKIDYSAKEKIPYQVRQREHLDGVRRSPPVVDLNDDPPAAHSYNSPSEPNTSTINDGARDIGGTPTSILLLRGLDPISTEQEIAKYLQHIPDPSQTVLADSVRKVMLIKDRLSNVSWGYAFVQFSDVQIAVKALSLLLNTSLFPRGFQIRARALTVTFAHEHSFHPVYTSSDWSFKGPGGQELAYWDDKAYAAVFVPAIHIADVTEDSSRQTSNNTVKTNQERYDRKIQSATKDDDEDMKELLSSLDNDQKNSSKTPTAKSLASSSFNNPRQHQQQPDAPDSPSQDNKTSDGPQNLNKALNDGAAAVRDRSNNESRDPRVSSSKHLVSSSSKTDLVQATEPSQVNSKAPENVKVEKKRGTELIVSKKNAVNIEKWNSKKTQENSAAESNTSNHVDTIENPTEGNDEDFSVLERLTCVLCQRLFKTASELARHNELSTLHKTNLQSEELKRAARLRMSQANAAKPSTTSVSIKRSASENDVAPEGLPPPPKYTDRAAARRETYGQPDAPDADKHEAKKARYEPAPERVLPQAQPDKDGISANNVGSKMLSKMGWNAGEGLGNGNGRVDPVTAAQYTKGVGLGASTGTTVGLYDDTKKGFMEQVKDKTVERFNKD